MAEKRAVLPNHPVCESETGAGELQIGQLGFNGELCDPVTGHYLLGNGYRAFNPVLMRFNSPDNLSPFDKGGINAYAYCQGDPVNCVDVDGHFFAGLLSGIKFLAPLFEQTTVAMAFASAGLGVSALIAKDDKASAILGTIAMGLGGISLFTGAIAAIPRAHSWLSGRLSRANTGAATQSVEMISPRLAGRASQATPGGGPPAYELPPAYNPETMPPPKLAAQISQRAGSIRMGNQLFPPIP